jgi:hypothetical protein
MLLGQERGLREEFWFLEMKKIVRSKLISQRDGGRQWVRKAKRVGALTCESMREGKAATLRLETLRAAEG